MSASVHAYSDEPSAGFASPLLYKDRLYLLHDNTKQSFLMALDKRTGRDIWRVNRSEGAGIWATPIIWDDTVFLNVAEADLNNLSLWP